MALMAPPPLPTRYRDDETPYSAETAARISSRYDEWKGVCARSRSVTFPELHQKEFLSDWLDDPAPESYHKPAREIFRRIGAGFTEEVLTEVFLETLGQMVEEIEPWIKQSLRRLDNEPLNCRRWGWQPVTFKDVERGQAQPWDHLWYDRESKESTLADWMDRKDKDLWIDNLKLLRDELHWMIRIMKKLQLLEKTCLLKYQEAVREGKGEGFRSGFDADFFPRRIHQGGSGY